MVDWNGTPTPTATSETPDLDHDEVTVPASSAQAGYDFPYDPTLEHDGSRSLSTIALHAFCLGFFFATSTLLTYIAGSHGRLYWRLWAFMACLSGFHFLEFWTTARFNPLVVRADSFLLFTNGRAYNIAYFLALLEILVSSFLAPSYATWFTSVASRGIGMFLVLLGQSVRSLAMAQAGRNFNHTPQRKKKDGHTLVTEGIYAVLRHPSYFGFFWWAIGTQLLVGNKFCVLGYTVVLWHFFSRRIKAEEVSLIDFFGEDYKKFRAKTGTGIPFIR